MKSRRLGCLFFGVCWAIAFGFTNFGLAIGDPVDPNAINPLGVLFWVEVAVLVAVGWLFYRAEKKDSEF